MSPIYRPATAADITQILGLQEQNLVTNLTPAERDYGFVTTPFDTAQLTDLIARRGMFVVADGQRILGYAAAAGWDYFAGRPLFDLMISRFQQLSFHGIRIDRSNSFQYGPVCIAREHRGSGLFPALFAEMNRCMKADFAVGTSFINQINGRSFAAHTQKVGLAVIDEFEFNNNRYWGLAF